MWLGLVAVATAGVMLTGCGSDSDDEGSGTEDTGSGSEVVAGLAFDTGGRGDGTFNDSAAAGSDKAKTDLGV